MEKKFWFDYVDLKTLEKYIRKHIVGNPYDMERLRDQELIKVSYDVRNDDYTYTEYLTPYGLTGSPNLVSGFNHGVTNPATKELFNIMYKATKGVTIDGKSYAEAFNDARVSGLKNTYNSNIAKINKEIEKLETSRAEECDRFLKQCKEVENFVNPIIEEDKKQKSLIVADILKGMSPEEQREVLAKLGYVPAKIAQDRRKSVSTQDSEQIVLNNGLNDIVLDFNKPNKPEVDECDDYYV